MFPIKLVLTKPLSQEAYWSRTYTCPFVTLQKASGRKCSEEQIKLNLPTASVWFQLLSCRWDSRRSGSFILFAQNDAAKLCLSKRHTKSTNNLAANSPARYFWRLWQRQWSFVCADGGDKKRMSEWSGRWHSPAAVYQASGTCEVCLFVLFFVASRQNFRHKLCVVEHSRSKVWPCQFGLKTVWWIISSCRCHLN